MVKFREAYRATKISVDYRPEILNLYERKAWNICINGCHVSPPHLIQSRSLLTLFMSAHLRLGSVQQLQTQEGRREGEGNRKREKEKEREKDGQEGTRREVRREQLHRKWRCTLSNHTHCQPHILPHLKRCILITVSSLCKVCMHTKRGKLSLSTLHTCLQPLAKC